MSGVLLSALRPRLAQRAALGARRWAGSSPPDPKYNNFRAPHVSRPHRLAGEFFGTVTWLWVFWRTKQDGAAIFFGEHPWEAHHGDEDDHDDHHHHESFVDLKWTKEIGRKPELLGV